MKNINNNKRAHKNTARFNRAKLALFVLILVIAGGGIFFFRQYQNAVRNPQAQIEQNNSRETKEVVSKLSKILLLPSDKQPTVAKVEDVEKLKKSNENFYKDVTKDDYLVLYTDRAIIYRKKENKIINIAPIVDTSKVQAETPE